MAPENGRVLKVRIGMNPDYGIMFGSMVFVPYAVVGTFLVNVCLSPSLDEALKKYGQRSASGRLRCAFLAASWGLSWVGFSGVWTFFMSSIGGAVSPYSLELLSDALSLTISYLAYR
ncbi:MAG TPA: hypothetical protein GX510_04310 [Firmicutes bacterium]|nr:hypothetical protein [Candidatus Fermentithermobacillaceae bacterium]